MEFNVFFDQSRRRRGGKWPKNDLTYSVVQYSRQLANSEVYCTLGNQETPSPPFRQCNNIVFFLTRLITWWPRLWRHGVTWLHWHGGKGLGRRISRSAGIRENFVVKNINLKTRMSVQYIKEKHRTSPIKLNIKPKPSFYIGQPHQVDDFLLLPGQPGIESAIS